MKKYLCVFFLFFNISMYAQNSIIVSKKDFQLIVINSKSDTICCYKCGLGANFGNKQHVGDKRTPEGAFVVSSIEDSKSWTHDFNDGYGQREGAYGPYFIRLRTSRWSGIGIHGTCFPESIGTRSSEGCIRMNNDDIAELIKYIDVGTKVIIEKDINQ